MKSSNIYIVDLSFQIKYNEITSNKTKQNENEDASLSSTALNRYVSEMFCLHHTFVAISTLARETMDNDR